MTHHVERLLLFSAFLVSPHHDFHDCDVSRDADHHARVGRRVEEVHLRQVPRGAMEPGQAENS